MLVKECMTKQVELGNPNMSVREIAKKMREGDFGILPVGDGDRLIGVVTDRDIVVRAVAEGKNLETLQAKDILSKKVLYCYEDQSLEEIAQNLGDNQVRRLPVLNRQKRLVGILSLGDMSHSLNASQQEDKPHHIEKALHRISQKPGFEKTIQ